MDRPRLFFSFSGIDKPLVRQIFSRLLAQQLELWNYADEREEIPGGARIVDNLVGHIDASTIFIPLVTPNLLGSEYCAREAERAISREKQGLLRIIPIELLDPAGPLPPAWPTPFSGLQSYRYRSLDFKALPASSDPLAEQLHRRERIENVIIELCRDIGVAYLPLPTMDPRLPFLDRFETEIKGCVARHKAGDIAIHSRLMAIFNEFQTAYQTGDYKQALARIDYFTAMCEFEFPGERVYFPHVVRAICQICSGELTRARETLEALRRPVPHPLLDENVYGAMGYLLQERGLYHEALTEYREAARRDPKDPAAKAGVILNSLHCGEPFDVELAFSEIDSGRIALPEDREKIRALKALAYFRNGQYDNARRDFEALIRDGNATAPTIVNCAHVLVRMNQHARAIDLLKAHRARLRDEALLHLLATLSFQTGQFASAESYFLELVSTWPSLRQYRIDAAQILWAIGKKPAALAQAAAVLDPKNFPLPSKPEEFYLDGFANWFLGRPERAQYDFQRSQRPPSDDYAQIMSKLERHARR